MFLTETHMHTKLASPCCHVDPAVSVPEYAAKGYTTLVITDHFKRFCREHYQKQDPTAWIDHYLSGYRIACKAAERIGGMHILLGMEITFDENANDYLVYGPTEEDLYREPAMYTWGLRRFHDYAAEQGWLVIQAHPFRNHMSVTPPHHIDGIEVCNANPRHDSRNDIATSWANKFQLLKTAGSDYHQLEDLARGGIITDAPITSTAELMEAIRQRAGLYIGNHR